jgi:hypothetical protein
MSTRTKTLGNAISAVPMLVMLLTAGLKISHYPLAVENFAGKFGLSEGLLAPLGVVQIVCSILYVWPRTATVGAILVTAYLGGATATELRASGAVAFPVFVGLFVWAGLALRNPQVASALGIRSGK